VDKFKKNKQKFSYWMFVHKKNRAVIQFINSKEINHFII